jgi:energy-coupling factor transporter ATP-binding protein EcfA2
MIQSATLHHYGPIHEFRWENLGHINLLIGENGSGKSFLLKALYSAVRTVEETGRGNDPREVNEVLFDRLYWTFQAGKLGDLVEKGGAGPLAFEMRMDEGEFTYGFGKDTSRSISNVRSKVPGRAANSIFLPAKEVLSLHDVILKSRDQDRSFGFDDTYVDLARALQLSRTRGRQFAAFAESRKQLEHIVQGRVEYDEQRKAWFFERGRYRYPIETTAEGIKKIAILDILIGNRYLSPRSIVFVDEPESALHPDAIVRFLEILRMMAQAGVQFFIATHSYFVIKKLYLIAQEHHLNIPLAAHGAEGWRTTADLRDGMPENAIVDASIRLYEQEVELALG